MINPYGIAEILDEIAQKTDPVHLIRRWIQDNLKSHIDFNIETRSYEKTVTITYYFPVENVMQQVDGTAEQVMQWLQTGASCDCKAKFDTFHNRKCIAIEKSFRGDPGYTLVTNAMNEALKHFRP